MLRSVSADLCFLRSVSPDLLGCEVGNQGEQRMILESSQRAGALREKCLRLRVEREELREKT